MAETQKISLPQQSGVHYSNPNSVRLVTGDITTGIGANPITIDVMAIHGIQNIKSAMIVRNESTAPALDPNNLSCTWNGNILSIYRWKHTNATTPSMIASTKDIALTYWVMGTV